MAISGRPQTNKQVKTLILSGVSVPEAALIGVSEYVPEDSLDILTPNESTYLVYVWSISFMSCEMLLIYI